MNCSKSVFVTVGTTGFDELIRKVTTERVKAVLAERGYDRLTLQIGRGDFQPETSSSLPKTEFYRFKDSIAEDIKSASLVISHAGAGSVSESLESGKSLLVVVNENLMGNHQVELAQKLKELHYLFYCTCSTLEETLRHMDLNELHPYRSGDPKIFSEFLDSLMGYRES
ncbi:UDP-N-acetylglucosamine transferase subunit ALG13-like [Oscarella lobularis]|uniref:UDP-N-acetylglucosamine transferase subunit ALG13-like n=1 Tax=Oscarella lobularis TaxID=121494 RepID=UPI0033144014